MSVAFSPVAVQLNRTLSMEQNSRGGAAVNYTPFIYNARTYMAVIYRDPGNVFNYIKVVKSTLDPTVWTVLDDANSPQMDRITLNSSAIFDGVSTLTICFFSSVTSGPVKFQDFDLVTETWGAVYGTVGAPTARQVNQIFVRSDASRVLLFRPNALTGLDAAVYAAGAWSAPYAVDTNVAAASNGAAAAVLDIATDIIHVFLHTTGNTTTYQQILANDTLGVFTNFAAGDATFAYQQMANPVIVGNFIVFGMADPTGVSPVVIVGTPVAAPVFTVSAAIDIPYAQTPADAPYLAFDGTTIYAIIANDTGFGTDAGNLRIGTNVNLTTPDSGWVFQELGANLGHIAFPAVGFLSNGSIYGMYQLIDPVSGIGNLAGALILFSGALSFLQINISTAAIVILPNPSREC